ncbi:20320_t:CDS:2 [Cetraspora pellucida]|uniref:20320_t:CDS:1 n=1 Tax=Cetraspora pellucida TaxID=1433469 RepID=A0A9N9HH95_9GLOM|nr:20320_t:CDS:2 [Cetraspora pellucida]
MNKYINIDNDSMSNIFGSDSDSKIFRNDSEVKTVKSHNIMFLEYLNNTIKQLKKEIKKYSYKKIKASIIVAKAAKKDCLEVRKEMYINGHEHADVVVYYKKFLERITEFEAHMKILVMVAKRKATILQKRPRAISSYK